MSKSDIKAAMQLLQVNKPLKLQARAPSFIPPAPTTANPTPVENISQVEKPTEVELQTQVPNKTQGENPTEDVNPIKVITPAQVESITPDLKTTEVINESQVQLPTEVGSDTKVEKVTQVMNETTGSKTTEVRRPENQPDQVTAVRRATEQDSSVVLEARACEGLEKGYTRLPNSLLMKMANGDLTRGEIKILLLIARFTISFQRKLAPLSKAVLERQSGLRGAGVLEAIAGLVAKNMIVKEQGDQHRPNMLGLVLPENWDQLIGKSETSVAKTTQVQKRTEDNNQTLVSNPAMVTKQTSGEIAKPTSAPVANPAPFKDIKIYSNKNSHAQTPELLQKYFDELKPAKKRESELKAFQELCLDYSSQDIVDCFTVLRDRGIGEGAEACHSPMAFLSKAMDSIFAGIKERRQKNRERTDREQREAKAKQLRIETEAREVAEWDMKEKAFLDAFPDETRRQEVLVEMCQNSPFKLVGESMRIMGIGRWYEINTQQK